MADWRLWPAELHATLQEHGWQKVHQAGLRALRYPAILATAPYEIAAIVAALEPEPSPENKESDSDPHSA